MNCDCDHNETCAVCVPSLHGAKQATPHEQLIDELRDSTIPKNEREWAAAREIEKNQDRIAAGHRLALELECLLMDTKDMPTVSRWWETGMEALDAWQKLFPYNGPMRSSRGPTHPLTAINKMFGWHQDAAGPNCESA